MEFNYGLNRVNIEEQVQHARGPVEPTSEVMLENGGRQGNMCIYEQLV